jgi:hypothetical protein
MGRAEALQMTPARRYQTLSEELDRLVLRELELRVIPRPVRETLSDIEETIEAWNRRLVQAHQRGVTTSLAPDLLSGYLQLQPGGRLFVNPDSAEPAEYQRYRGRRKRFETLFTAAVSALPDPELADLIRAKRALFVRKMEGLSELLTLAQAARGIQLAVERTVADPPGLEEQAVAYLNELAPLRADLRTLEHRSAEFGEDPYLDEARRLLERNLQSARRVMAEKSRRAARFLFDQAGSLFQSFKATPADLSHLDQFVYQKEALTRYAHLFESVGETDRKERVDGFIQTIDAAVGNLQDEIGRQKAMEAKISERQQKAVRESYERFEEIKAMYGRGELAAESQRKNALERLRKYRDTFKAHGQRTMARDVERFLNATGLGQAPTENLPATREDAKGKPEGFDYKRGFWILMGACLVLVLLLALFIMI